MCVLKRSASVVACLCVLMFVIVFGTGCEGTKNTEEDAFLGKLEGKWTARNVNVDGQFVNGAFAGFSITFVDKTFTTANGNSPIWPPAGTFSIKEVSSSVGYNLARSDGVEISILELTESTLILQFFYSNANARTNSVGGDYTFELQR